MEFKEKVKMLKWGISLIPVIIYQGLLDHLIHKWAWYELNFMDKLILKLLYGVNYKELGKKLN